MFPSSEGLTTAHTPRLSNYSSKTLHICQNQSEAAGKRARRGVCLFASRTQDTYQGICVGFINARLRVTALHFMMSLLARESSNSFFCLFVCFGPTVQEEALRREIQIKQVGEELLAKRKKCC